MLRVKGQLGSSSCSYLQIILHTEEAVVLCCKSKFVTNQALLFFT